MSNLKHTKPGDVLTRGGFYGWFGRRVEVLDVDPDRRFAYACVVGTDDLEIINMEEVNNIPAGTGIQAQVGCKEFLSLSRVSRKEAAMFGSTK